MTVPPRLRCAVYTRGTDPAALAAQLGRCHAFLSGHAASLVSAGLAYSDGPAPGEEGIAPLLADAEAAAFDSVVVDSADVLGGTADELAAAVRRLAELGVAVFGAGDGFASDSAAARRLAELPAADDDDASI